MAIPTSIDTLKEIRDEFYGGSWEAMLSDLRSKLVIPHYTYKLHDQIKTDIRVIEGTLENHKETV